MLMMSTDPGGGRHFGQLYYRYFHQPSLSWWCGVNGNLMGNAVVIFKASKILNKPSYRALAMRQLDWVLGENPFDASCISGVGYNHPSVFRASEFSPPTPVIDGGAFSGPGDSQTICPT